MHREIKNKPVCHSLVSKLEKTLGHLTAANCGTRDDYSLFRFFKIIYDGKMVTG